MSWGRAKKAPLKYLACSGPSSVSFSVATMATPALVSGGAAAGSGGGSIAAGRTAEGATAGGEGPGAEAGVGARACAVAASRGDPRRESESGRRG